MGRINLYVADALEERMAGYRDRLNWSRIAQEAFEQAIKIEEMKEGKMQEAQLERLRASRKANAETNHALGFAKGKEWALNLAEFDELERVVSIDQDWAGDDPRESAQYELAKAVLDEDRPSVRGCDECLESLFDDANPTAEEIEGFIDGATEVYAAV